MISSFDVGIQFGEKMGDSTMQRRYGPLYKGLAKAGLSTVFLRRGQGYQDDRGNFSDYSTLETDGGVVRHDSPVNVVVLRDFSGAYDRRGTFPINHPGVWRLTRDKLETRRALDGMVPMPYGLEITDQTDLEEVRRSMPGILAVVKPSLGRASKNVNTVRLDDREDVDQAVRAILPHGPVLIEEYIDTTRGVPLEKNRLDLPGTQGRPNTVRLITIDGEVSVVAVRIGVAGESKVSGDESEEYRFVEPSMLCDDALSIASQAHLVAAKRGNGHSYIGVDLLYDLDGSPLLGELNSRPEIIEPRHSVSWSQRLVLDSVRQIKRARQRVA